MGDDGNRAAVAEMQGSPSFVGRRALIQGRLSGLSLATEQLLRNGGACLLGDSDFKLEYGRADGFDLDLYVHDASLPGWQGDSCKCSLASWNEAVAENLTAPYDALRSILPSMAARGGGRVALIVSVDGKEPKPERAIAAATSAGLIGMVKSMGREFSGRGVFINCVTIDSDDAAAPAYDKDVAEVVGWVLSDACRLATGSVFDTSRGRTTW